MNVRIIIDSTADVTPEVKEKVTVIPMHLYFGDEEYVDGVSLTYKQFYEKLIESDEMPRTSQANPDMFLNVFKEVHEKGEKAVVITLASTLSGTYQNALIAAEDYEDSIYVVDSKNATIGSGILVELAVRLAEQGMDAKELAETLEKERENICLMGMVDTLEYLRKGGRISKTAAVAGELLSIKPVLCISDGKIEVLGKARGSKKANNYLIQEITKAGGIDFKMPLLLGYGGLTDVLLQKYIEDSRAIWEGNTDHLNCSCIGSVIGTHLGPGSVAIAFFKNQKEQ